MESAEYWRALFDHWPENIERRGSILTKQGEAISFTGFLISAGILYTERSAPDASGNRKAFMSWEQIALVKLPTTMPIDEFLAMGFREAKGKPVGKPTGKSTGKSGT